MLKTSALPFGLRQIDIQTIVKHNAVNLAGLFLGHVTGLDIVRHSL